MRKERLAARRLWGRTWLGRSVVPARRWVKKSGVMWMRRSGWFVVALRF
jgi:hypothetical protein